MKTNSLIVVLTVIILNNACSMNKTNSNPLAKNALTGVWEWKQHTNRITISFDSNGNSKWTSEGAVDIRLEDGSSKFDWFTEETLTGKLKKTAGELYINYNIENKNRDKQRFKANFRIAFVNKHRLHLINEDEIKLEFKKVK